MIKRRSLAAGLGERICNYAFHATGITAYLEGGTKAVERLKQFTTAADRGAPLTAAASGC